MTAVSVATLARVVPGPQGGRVPVPVALKVGPDLIWVPSFPRLVAFLGENPVSSSLVRELDDVLTKHRLAGTVPSDPDWELWSPTVIPAANVPARLRSTLFFSPRSDLDHVETWLALRPSAEEPDPLDRLSAPSLPELAERTARQALLACSALSRFSRACLTAFPGSPLLNRDGLPRRPGDLLLAVARSASISRDDPALLPLLRGLVEFTRGDRSLLEAEETAERTEAARRAGLDLPPDGSPGRLSPDEVADLKLLRAAERACSAPAPLPVTRRPVSPGAEVLLDRPIPVGDGPGAVTVLDYAGASEADPFLLIVLRFSGLHVDDGTWSWSPEELTVSVRDIRSRPRQGPPGSALADVLLGILRAWLPDVVARAFPEEPVTATSSAEASIPACGSGESCADEACPGHSSLSTPEVP